MHNMWRVMNSSLRRCIQDEELRRVLGSLATVMGRHAPPAAAGQPGSPALRDATGAACMPPMCSYRCSVCSHRYWRLKGGWHLPCW